MTEYEYHMNKLVEECGELVQIAMKVKNFGVDSTNPDTGECNRDLYIKELGDVFSSAKIVAGFLDVDFDDEHVKKRKEKMDYYYNIYIAQDK